MKCIHTYIKYNDHESVLTKAPFQITHFEKEGEIIYPKQGGGDFQTKEKKKSEEEKIINIHYKQKYKQRIFIPTFLN